MNRLLSALLALVIIMASGGTLEAKNYVHKAPRPAASDHTWSDYDYNFNLDENGDLTGTNTFSIVYNSAPTKWKNEGYYGEGIRMYTGHETLTITVLPGAWNYKYTLVSDVTEWQWDTHQLKWVRSRSMPSNGTRTFTVKDGQLNGTFEIPTVASPWGVTFMCGTSANGVIPAGQRLWWKGHASTASSPVTRMEIQSDGDSLRLSTITYLENVKEIDLSGNTGLGQFGNSEAGDHAILAFPCVRGQHELDLLDAVGSKAGVMSKLERYSQIPLPQVFCDRYVDPYAPVTKILDNGHKLVTTRQPNRSVHTVETWDENGYSYTKKHDDRTHPAIGRKVVGDTTFYHYKDFYDQRECVQERGFVAGRRYHLTSKTNRNGHTTTVDYSRARQDGYVVIADEYGKYLAYYEDGYDKPSLSSYTVETLTDMPAAKYRIFKKVDNEGVTTVHPAITSELSGEALGFVNFLNHPYVQHKWTSDAPLTQLVIDPDGKVVLRPNSFHWHMLRMYRQPDNPLVLLQQYIAMELDLPDYDLTIDKKANEKIIGKRTAKLLNEIPKWLNEKLHDGSIKMDANRKHYKDLWPNTAKRVFLKDNERDDFKKARISRIAKRGKDVSVFVTTTYDNRPEKTTELRLHDNLPVDEYGDLWWVIGKNTK